MVPVPPEARLLGARSRLIAVASTGYVGAVAIGATPPEHRLRATLCSLVAVGVASALGARDRLVALTGWGLAFALAAFGGEGSPWLEACGAVGACAASVGASIAIARVVAPSGIARPSVRAPWIALGGVAVAWVPALVARVLFASHVVGALSASASFLAPLAAVASFFVLTFQAWRASTARRLELGVAARMNAAWALVGAALAVALAVPFADFVSIEPSLDAGVALASLLVAAVSMHGDPVAIALASRRAVALVLVGGPVVLIGVLTAQSNPWQASGIVAAIGVIALVVGLAAPVLEEPLRPARGAWLDATKAAHEALLRTDPDEAIREALVALRVPAGLDAPSPELWTFEPLRVTRVDAAGYAHVEGGVLPESLVAYATREPEAILRHEVLEAFEVRRAELRPLARWMSDRGAMLAVVVTRGGEAEGLLTLPLGKRTEALSLEEARAVKRLADALAALCHARASLARSLARERSAEIRAESAESTLAAATRELERRAAHPVLAAERLARPATVGIYSAAARFAFDAIEDAARADRVLFVHAPSGADAIPYVARAHLGGARRGEPLVVVDGTGTREHDVARWTDPSQSPLALVHRGTLVLLDGAALPAEVQAAIGRALTEKRAPWDADAIFDASLVLTSATPFDATRARLEPSLAARFDGAPRAALPRLRDRPEDLRAILSDRLAREGLRVRGAPVGIDDAAFARLLDHAFDGEDAELAAIVVKLVAACAGDDVVRARHVDALGLAPASEARREAGE